jgi:hypothetical protein
MKQQSESVAPACREVAPAGARRGSRNVTDPARNRASGVIIVTFRPPPRGREPHLAARRTVARKGLDILNFINLSGWTAAPLRR